MQYIYVKPRKLSKKAKRGQSFNRAPNLYNKIKGHSRRAKLMRKPTEAERYLMQHLTIANGWQFQAKVIGYYPDFSHAGSKVIVECDGGIHWQANVHARDLERTQHLESAGWAVLRFSNQRIILSPSSVASTANALVAKRFKSKVLFIKNPTL